MTGLKSTAQLDTEALYTALSLKHGKLLDQPATIQMISDAFDTATQDKIRRTIGEFVAPDTITYEAADQLLLNYVDWLCK